MNIYWFFPQLFFSMEVMLIYLLFSVCYKNAMVWQDGRKRSLTPADQQPGQADGENEKQIVSTRDREREADECRLCS
jgi:hypothetical protein